MAKEKFDWKGLFINDADESGEPSEAKTSTKASSSTSFPDQKKSGAKFPQSPPKPVGAVSNDVLVSVLKKYEAGFESLNQPGYDFYEFFKAIKSVGSDDSQVYKMAMTMAQSVDAGVSKEKLLTQADFYITEIKKVHKEYEIQGKNKKSSVEETQKSKKKKLNAEITALERKLMEAQHQISTKKNELQTLDTSLLSEVSEIDQKIVANDTAKSRILKSIMSVVDGIKKNI